MAIYAKPVRELMIEMAEELASAPDATFTRKDAVSWFSAKYPKIKPGTVTAHLTRLSTNARSRTHYGAKPGEDDIFYQIDRSRYRRYRSGQDPEPIYSYTPDPDQPVVPGGDEDEELLAEERSAESGEFAYEADLRNYLSKNLHQLESGLRVYEDEGVTGVEFPVGGRFIDILGIDTDRNLVVIELKVSRGYDRVVGQLMRYVAWIKKNLADETQSVRGMIVARQISEDLLLACSLVPEVELYEYQLSLSLNRIKTAGS